jgi:hypothetical protein
LGYFIFPKIIKNYKSYPKAKNYKSYPKAKNYKSYPKAKNYKSYPKAKNSVIFDHPVLIGCPRKRMTS